MDANIDPIALLSEAVSRLPELESENQELRESVAEVRAMLARDDSGWQLIQGLTSGERLEGLDLDEVHDIIRMVQPRVIAAGLTKRACDLHTSWVFGKDVQIEGTNPPKGAGAKPGIYKFFSNPVNQESLFSASAQAELQKSRFVEGTVIAACNTKTKTVRRIPMLSITGVRVDPDDPTRVIAYKRTWERQTDAKTETKSEWLFTHRFEGKRPTAIGTGNERVPVNQDVTVVDLRVNTAPGFVLGVPDAVSGISWAETYTLALRAGVTVTEGLSRLIFKVTNKTKQGVQSSAVKIGNSQGAGNAVSLVEGQDVEAIRTAGAAYSFEKLIPIVGPAAAGWNVSTADLLNSSSAAGSSYGALSGIAPGNRNAMTLMQRQWTSFYQDIFWVMGFDRPDTHWEPLETPDPYRQAQALTLLAPTLHDQEYRGKALDIADITGEPSDIPPTLKARNVVDTSNGNAGVQQASPDQGVANGSGGGGQGANDLRSDGIGESLRKEMALESLIERFESIAARLDAQSN